MGNTQSLERLRNERRRRGRSGRTYTSSVNQNSQASIQFGSKTIVGPNLPPFDEKDNKNNINDLADWSKPVLTRQGYADFQYAFQVEKGTHNSKLRFQYAKALPPASGLPSRLKNIVIKTFQSGNAMSNDGDYLRAMRLVEDCPNICSFIGTLKYPSNLRRPQARIRVFEFMFENLGSTRIEAMLSKRKRNYEDTQAINLFQQSFQQFVLQGFLKKIAEGICAFHSHGMFGLGISRKEIGVRLLKKADEASAGDIEVCFLTHDAKFAFPTATATTTAATTTATTTTTATATVATTTAATTTAATATAATATATATGNESDEETEDGSLSKENDISAFGILSYELLTGEVYNEKVDYSLFEIQEMGIFINKMINFGMKDENVGSDDTADDAKDDTLAKKVRNGLKGFEVANQPVPALV